MPANALGPYHAQRALSALAAFGVKDWPRWAHRMGVSPKDVLPPEARQEHARSLEGASPTGEVLLGSGFSSPMAAGLSSSMAADLSPSSAAAVGTSAVQAPKAPPKKRKTVSELSTNRQLGIVKSMARRMATAASAAVIAEESGDEFGYSSSMDSDSEQAVRAAVMIKQVLPSDLRWGGAAGGGDAGSGSSSSIGATSGNRVLGAVSAVEGLGQRSVFSTYDPSLGETSSEGEDEVIGVEAGSRSSQLQALAAAAEARAAELAGQLKAAKAKAKAYRRSKAKALAL